MIDFDDPPQHRRESTAIQLNTQKVDLIPPEHKSNQQHMINQKDNSEAFLNRTVLRSEFATSNGLQQFSDELPSNRNR